MKREMQVGGRGMGKSKAAGITDMWTTLYEYNLKFPQIGETRFKKYISVLKKENIPYRITSKKEKGTTFKGIVIMNKDILKANMAIFPRIYKR